MTSQTSGTPRCRMATVTGLVVLAAPLPRGGGAVLHLQTEAIPPQCIYFDARSLQ